MKHVVVLLYLHTQMQKIILIELSERCFIAVTLSFCFLSQIILAVCTNQFLTKYTIVILLALKALQYFSYTKLSDCCCFAKIIFNLADHTNSFDLQNREEPVNPLRAIYTNLRAIKITL